MRILRIFFELFFALAIAFLLTKACSVGNAGSLKRKIKTVVVLDTGIDLKNQQVTEHMCKYGHKDFTGQGLDDVVGHGTSVSSLIIENATSKDYCLVIVKYFIKDTNNTSRYLDALRYSINIQPSIVNYSGGGADVLYLEYLLIRSNRNIRFIVAAGNSGKDLSKMPFYPASYYFDNITSVGSLDKSGNIAAYSNYGEKINSWEMGTEVDAWGLDNKRVTISGTSMATAIKTGKEIGR